MKYGYAVVGALAGAVTYVVVPIEDQLQRAAVAAGVGIGVTAVLYLYAFKMV